MITYVFHARDSSLQNYKGIFAYLVRENSVNYLTLGFKVHTRAVPVVISSGLQEASARR